MTRGAIAAFPAKRLVLAMAGALVSLAVSASAQVAGTGFSSVADQGLRPAWFYQPGYRAQIDEMSEAQLEIALDEAVDAERSGELDAYYQSEAFLEQQGLAEAIEVEPIDAPDASAPPKLWITSLSIYASLSYDDNPGVATTGDGPADESAESILSTGPSYSAEYGDESTPWQLGFDYRLGVRLVLEGTRSDDGFDQGGGLRLNYIGGKTKFTSSTSFSYDLRDNLDAGTRGNELQIGQGFSLDYTYSPKTSAGASLDFELIGPEGAGRRNDAGLNGYLKYSYSPKTAVGIGANTRVQWFGDSETADDNNEAVFQGYFSADYDSLRSWTVGLRLGVDQRRYDDGETALDPYGALSFDWKVSELLSVSVEAEADYVRRDSGATELAPNFRASLSYLLPTETSLGLSAYTGPSNSFRSSETYVRSGVSLTASQRLFAQLSLSLTGGYEISDYESRDAGVEGSAYSEDYAFGRVSLGHPLGVRATVSAYYQYSQRAQDGDSEDRISNQAGLSLSVLVW